MLLRVAAAKRSDRLGSAPVTEVLKVSETVVDVRDHHSSLDSPDF